MSVTSQKTRIFSNSTTRTSNLAMNFSFGVQGWMWVFHQFQMVTFYNTPDRTFALPQLQSFNGILCPPCRCLEQKTTQKNESWMLSKGTSHSNIKIFKPWSFTTSWSKKCRYWSKATPYLSSLRFCFTDKDFKNSISDCFAFSSSSSLGIRSFKEANTKKLDVCLFPHQITKFIPTWEDN